MTTNENQQQHVKTLTRLLDQLSGLNVNEDSRGRLEEALRAAVDALEGAEPEQTESSTSSGLDLSDESVNDHLSRVAQGRPSASAEKNAAAVNHLASLVSGLQEPKDESGASGQLARLVRNEA